MDEMLGVGGPIPGNEDSDFTYRCLRKRIRVFHLSSNQITHYPEEKSTKEDIIKKARGYCISNGARYIKYMRAGDCQSIFFLIANMASWYWDSLWILVRKQKFYRLPKWLFIPYFMLLITYWHINGICISFKYAVDSSTMKFKIRRCLKSESL